jgi:hypothetical protein
MTLGGATNAAGVVDDAGRRNQRCMTGVVEKHVSVGRARGALLRYASGARRSGTHQVRADWVRVRRAPIRVRVRCAPVGYASGARSGARRSGARQVRVQVRVRRAFRCAPVGCASVRVRRAGRVRVQVRAGLTRRPCAGSLVVDFSSSPGMLVIGYLYTRRSIQSPTRKLRTLA